MMRFLDRGAIVAGWVGLGMAVTVGISFLLVIPIEPIYWLLTPFAGVLIGYYANQRSDRRAGPWGRILANALYAGAVTAVTLALLLLAVKALFFFADTGYRDASLGGSITCQTGADCVYQRYLDADHGPDLTRAGVTNASAFTGFYWNQQFTTAGTLIGLCVGGGLLGGLMYGFSRPKATRSATTANPAAG